MTFITLLTILVMLATAILTEDIHTVALIPFIFKVLIENDNLKDRVYLLEEKLKGGDQNAQ